jgi:hypothetical protein
MDRAWRRSQERADELNNNRGPPLHIPLHYKDLLQERLVLKRAKISLGKSHAALLERHREALEAQLEVTMALNNKTLWRTTCTAGWCETKLNLRAKN